jgi:hypothetical protein
MARKSSADRAGANKQPPTPIKNEGLVTQIVLEFLKRLRASTIVEVGVTKSLEDLASKGKLKDLEAVQTALLTPPQENDNAPT